MTASTHALAPKQTLADLARFVISSNDGLALPEYINAIASYEGDPSARSSALIEIAKRNEFASHIVVGVLSGLALNNLPNAREFARSLISAPLDREKDLIIARAYSLLIELPPLDPHDVPTIVGGYSHPYDCVREATQRALTFLPMQSASLLREEIAKMPQNRVLAALREKLDASLEYKVARVPSLDFQELSEKKDRTPRIRSSSTEKISKVPQAATKQPVKRTAASTQKSERRPTTPAIQPYTLSDPKPSLPPSAPTQSTAAQQFPPLPTLPEYSGLSGERLHNLCLSVSDATRFIYALAEIVNRYGSEAAIPHSGRFIFFACQPDYPKDIFEQVSGRIFRKR